MARALAAAVAALLVAPALAMGTQGHAAAERTREPDRVPSAQLQASGRGAVTLHGRLSVNGSLRLRGTVVVIDRAGDAEAHLAGEPLSLERGKRTIARRARGILYVTGSRVTVRIVGRGLSFSIAGVGRASLRGVGRYRLNAAPATRWAPGWVALRPNNDRRRGRGRV